MYASVNWVSIGLGNGLSPVQCQAIMWTNAGLLSVRPLGTNLSEIQMERLSFSFTKMHLKISSVKWQPFCQGEDELILVQVVVWCHQSISHMVTLDIWLIHMSNPDKVVSCMNVYYIEMIKWMIRMVSSGFILQIYCLCSSHFLTAVSQMLLLCTFAYILWEKNEVFFIAKSLVAISSVKKCFSLA